MMVKFIEYDNLYDLENEVNDFIEGKKIIDIKYSSYYVSNYNPQGYSVMIIYEEVDE